MPIQLEYIATLKELWQQWKGTVDANRECWVYFKGTECISKVEWEGNSRRTQIGKWFSKRNISKKTREEENGSMLDMVWKRDGT